MSFCLVLVSVLENLNLEVITCSTFVPLFHSVFCFGSEPCSLLDYRLKKARTNLFFHIFFSCRLFIVLADPQRDKVNVDPQVDDLTGVWVSAFVCD